MGYGAGEGRSLQLDGDDWGNAGDGLQIHCRKIVAMWLPIMTFFALGFEHSVVNMFLIPSGMMLGASISVGQRFFWNLLPVTLGNLFAGTLLTGWRSIRRIPRSLLLPLVKRSSSTPAQSEQPAAFAAAAGFTKNHSRRPPPLASFVL